MLLKIYYTQEDLRVRLKGVFMTSNEVALLIDCSARAVRKATKKANEGGAKIIKIKKHFFSFEQIDGIGGVGKIYNYKKQEQNNERNDDIDNINTGNHRDTSISKNDTCKKEKINDRYIYSDKNHTNNDGALSIVSTYKRKATKFINPNFLNSLSLENVEKLTAKDKVSILGFMSASNSTIKTKIAILNMKFQNLNFTERKYRLWRKAFKENGILGLENKSKMNAKKVDDELVMKAVLGTGNVHYSSSFHYYCLLYAKATNKVFNPYKATSNITYGGYVSALKKITKDNSYLRAYLKGGIDELENTQFVGNRGLFAINEEWQIDATKIDFFALNDEGKAVRMSSIAVIDMNSKARVWGLYDSSSSYSNVRLLKKAITILGKPSLIRGDNGSDYVSKHFQDVLAFNGIDYYKCQVGKGYQKGAIERGFKTVQHSWLENIAGFCGHDVKQRMIREDQASSKLERFSGIQTSIDTDHLMSVAELEAVLDNYLGNVDKEKYAKHKNMEDIADIDKKIGKQKMITIGREGIRYANRQFVSLDMYTKFKVGDKALLIEDIDNMAIAYIYKDNKFICEVEDKEFADISVEEFKKINKAHRADYIAPMKALAKASIKTENEAYKQIAKNTALEITPLAKAEIERKTKKYRGVITKKQESSNVDFVDKFNKTKKEDKKTKRVSWEEIAEKRG